MGGFLQRQVASRPKLHVACCVIGIVGSLIVYSILQERIMTEPFGEEVFQYSLFLVLANRVFTFTVATTILLVRGLDMRPVAPSLSYAAVSVSNVMATTCQYEALKYVSFPLQTLGKCAKMIPVMVWGTIILRKTYRGKDYGLALTVTLGCTLFLSSGEVKSKQANRASDASLWGMLLMAGYLACDGFTSTFQSKLFKGYQMTIYNQILYTTLFSAGLSLFGLVSSGQLSAALAFVHRHPESLVSILTLSAASTAGQLCIVHTIRTFGPLLFATVMTTRQFISILVSCIIFSHPLSTGQWGGTLAVFGALFYKTFERKTQPAHAAPRIPEKKVRTGGVAAKPNVPNTAVEKNIELGGIAAKTG